MADTRPTLHGVLHLFSETGTEGGYWAFQDERFITPNTTRFSCRKCGAYWDKGHRPQGPVADEQAAGQLSYRGAPYCAPGMHEFELVCPGDWSYEGLHALEDGDELTIYAKDDPARIVWQGTIKLRRFPLFTEDAHGLWIHADQEGIDRAEWAKWFFEEYRATFRPAPKSGPTP